MRTAVTSEGVPRRKRAIVVIADPNSYYEHDKDKLELVHRPSHDK
jgi:hypothetical protein